jgi:hypothetical protein
MKINEILVESQLQEGPMLDKFGKAVGGVASGVAKGVGAVAGGIAGMGSAFKKGFSAGKTTVAGDDEAPKKPSMIGDLAKGLGKDAYKGATGYDLPGQDKASLKKKAAAPTASGTAAPAAAPAQQPAAAPGTAAPAAKAAPTAKPAAGSTPAAAPTAAPAAAPNPKADTAYAQAQKAVASLAPKQKSQLIKMLQSDPKVAAAAKAPAAAPAAAPAGKMANAPVSKTNTAKPGNPNATPAAAPEAPAADPQAGANAFGQMANTLSKQDGKPASAAKPPAAKPAAAAPEAPAAAAPDELGRVEPTMEPTKPAAGKEKTIANPVATVGTKRATNIGEPTFDTQTGKALSGQAINAIRKKAEYGTGPLGAARKRIKAGAAAPAESRRTTRPALAEGFSLFRKK